ncbi:MAG: hypothetical protein J1F39_00830 [Clostridiales bacterium]|nr:hypothetical protein [Clostridiales bacterium]
MNLIKKQGIGTWISLGAILLSIVALIIFGSVLSVGDNLDLVGMSEYLHKEDSVFTTVTVCGVLALVLFVAAIVLGQFKFDGILGTVVDVVVGALRVAAPALLVVAFFNFLLGTFNGLGWTFFSDEGIGISETAIKAGNMTIASVVLFVVAMLAGIVASFFAITKKVED